MPLAGAAFSSCVYTLGRPNTVKTELAKGESVPGDRFPYPVQLLIVIPFNNLGPGTDSDMAMVEVTAMQANAANQAKRPALLQAIFNINGSKSEGLRRGVKVNFASLRLSVTLGNKSTPAVRDTVSLTSDTPAFPIRFKGVGRDMARCASSRNT